jgi:hypothetical protein
MGSSGASSSLKTLRGLTLTIGLLFFGFLDRRGTCGIAYSVVCEASLTEVVGLEALLGTDGSVRLADEWELFPLEAFFEVVDLSAMPS